MNGTPKIIDPPSDSECLLKPCAFIILAMDPDGDGNFYRLMGLNSWSIEYNPGIHPSSKALRKRVSGTGFFIDPYSGPSLWSLIYQAGVCFEWKVCRDGGNCFSSHFSVSKFELSSTPLLHDITMESISSVDSVEFRVDQGDIDYMNYAYHASNLDYMRRKRLKEKETSK